MNSYSKGPTFRALNSNVRSEITSISASHFLTDLDLTQIELRALLDLASQVKATPLTYADHLSGHSVAILFEKPSLRTRVTFELAVKQLGGESVFLDHQDSRIGEREPIGDVARNLDRWVDAIVARTYSQLTLEELARWSSKPLINALSDQYHPCQVLADFQTLEEAFTTLKGLKLAFIGDGNNVAHSLMLNAPRLGVSVSIATPLGYEPSSTITQKAHRLAKESNSTLEVINDPVQAVEGASAVYTDIWTSMGWEAETQQRQIAFSKFQVTDELMAQAKPDAVFMHCLPALRGQEVTNSVIESSRSIVFTQAENRLHAHKALLLMMVS